MRPYVRVDQAALGKKWIRPYMIVIAHQKLSFSKLDSLRFADTDCVYYVMETFEKKVKKLLHTPCCTICSKFYSWFRNLSHPTKQLTANKKKKPLYT